MHLLFVLVVLLASAKLLGALAQRIGQPAVLGELVAGVILGGSALGLLNPSDPVISILSELGVIVLLFGIGLETEFRSMKNVAGTATAVALVGVVLPFALGYAVVTSVIGLERIPALVCAAALTATSVGISARVLSDLKQLTTREGQIVLAAAVLDDVVGLVVLAVVTGIVAAGRPVGGVPASLASAVILGSFAVGLALNATRHRAEIERVSKGVGYVVIPIFFASVGAAVELSAFAEAKSVAIGLALIAAGVIGKFAAGYAPWKFRGNKKLIGVAMIPRGEVGLIFAQMGLATQAITPSLYSAITLMVFTTTFLAPPLLARVSSSRAAA